MGVLTLSLIKEPISLIGTFGNTPGVKNTALLLRPVAFPAPDQSACSSNIKSGM